VIGEDSLVIGEDSLLIGEDSLVIGEDSLLIGEDSLVIGQVSFDTLKGDETTVRAKLTAGSWILSKDSVALIEYHHLGEIALQHPQAQLSHLGNYGQPAWIGMGASLPWQSTLTVDGLAIDNLLTGQPDPYRVSTEDAARFIVRPQYQAFWYGIPGDVMVVETEKRIWNAPRPITRLRHTESANEYLYTDGMFTLGASDESNIYLGLTRTSIGSTNNNNAARFPNNRHESWNARLAYRNRLSDLLTLTGRVQYDDHLTLLNGGIRGTFLPGSVAPYVYEAESSAFGENAFDPKAVGGQIVNETMHTEGQHYHVETGAVLQWDRDSAQVTMIRLVADSDVRRYRDNLASQYPEDSLAEPRMNLSDHWSLMQAVLDHRTQLGWAELDLQGAFGGYQAVMGGEALDDADIVAHARGRLGLSLGPVTVAGFARLDQRYGSSTISFGAGADIPLGPATVWGGASYAARPQSPYERRYTTPRVTATGDRSPDLDKYAIAEGGLRVDTDGFGLDLRGFIRNETRYSSLRVLTYHDTISGRYSLLYREIPDGEQRTVYGASGDVRLKLWRFHLDLRGSVLSSDRLRNTLTAPEFSGVYELYYRGGLIEGTLDLRAGARFSHSSPFLPLLHHPEIGVFLPDDTYHETLREYTDVKRIDLFLFATIKQRATIHVLLYNLLNDQHITTAFHPMFDRAFRLGVDWVFFD
ncbi:MAG: hypothetical protein KFF77_02655, partial [Bacteroidetes bacterium]|nr:hypothetical protein [Bacteroidota bacterium]